METFLLPLHGGARTQIVDNVPKVNKVTDIQVENNDYKNDPRAIKSPMVGTGICLNSANLLILEIKLSQVRHPY